MAQTNNILHAGTSTTTCHTAPLVTNNDDLFIDVYKKYRQPAYEMAMSFVGDKQASEDIVHDVFVKLWTQKDTLHQVKDMGAYIKTIVRNQFINGARRKKIESAWHWHLRLHKETEFNLPAHLEARETQRLLQLAIRALSPQRKKVFLLSWLEGWNRKEIAAELNIAENTVKNLMQTARKDIRAFMMKNNIDLQRNGVLKKLQHTWLHEKELKTAC